MDTIEKAFLKVKRENFLPDDVKEFAEIDRPLPIGYGQTNSQPFTVKQMLYWLEVKPGQKILDVGSGSGWTSALLSTLVGQKGRVYAVEIIPELVKFGESNCKTIGVKNVEFYEAESKFGLAIYAPYDRILVSAGARNVPAELIEQLKPGGKMVIPVNQDILEITKSKSGHIEAIAHPGFIFVPLIPKTQTD